VKKGTERKYFRRLSISQMALAWEFLWVVRIHITSQWIRRVPLVCCITIMQVLHADTLRGVRGGTAAASHHQRGRIVCPTRTKGGLFNQKTIISASEMMVGPDKESGYVVQGAVVLFLIIVVAAFFFSAPQANTSYPQDLWSVIDESEHHNRQLLSLWAPISRWSDERIIAFTALRLSSRSHHRYQECQSLPI
jgi:hypothetical protein